MNEFMYGSVAGFFTEQYSMLHHPPHLPHLIHSYNLWILLALALSVPSLSLP